MTPTRKKRLVAVAVIALGVGGATAIALYALRDNMLYFYTPTDIAAKGVEPGTRLRLGGLVVDGSLRRSADDLGVDFAVTDRSEQMPVTYQGILPDLFKEGQGVIAHGTLTKQGVLKADTVLAKHDENYMPPEVAEALEKAGHPPNAGQTP